MSLRRFYKKITPGFEVVDTKEWLKKKIIEIYLKPSPETPKICSKCGHRLEPAKVGEHFMKVRTMDIHGFKTYFCFKRPKHNCSSCKKTRTIKIDWISEETPHVTEEYAWWLGRLCEISPITSAAEFTGNDPNSLWRFDLKRMQRMFQHYKIPKVKRITVDEVYARKKKHYAKESRDNRFFTIVCDLDTRRVVWVSESRSKEALDEFFHAIGEERCKEIEVVAADQFDGYKSSVKENCPNATFVWDRFHIMQTFNKYLNDERAWLNNHMCKGEIKRLTRGKFKQLFSKKSDRRTKAETRHINDVMRDNQYFIYLELIKEGMYQIFDSKTAEDARKKFEEIGEWIKQAKIFYELEKWWKNFDMGWETFKNYFKYRITSSLSEGVNNVIKTVKKRAYGYRNMTYFKLKILQVCGFLNSKWVPMNFQ
ncbi:MAG: ISL3 family transposase [Deltaproteobacteria bacterium]|nr:ISL3 family transposase [Deltaproteobacteria bacterium]